MVESDGKGDKPYERRKSERIAVDMWVEDLTDDGQVFRRAANLSKGGIYLDQTVPMPIGSPVKLRLTLSGEQETDQEVVIIDGVIVAIAPEKTFGMSVKFVNVTAATQAKVDAFLARRGTPVTGTQVR